MKKIVMLLFLLPIAAMAQKEIKPSISKAEKALRAGKFDEAKAIIDVTVANKEFMTDKKGQPSKSAAKAWYMKGLIYAGIDTTKVEAYKKIADNPLATAKESFSKAYEIDKNSASFVTDAGGVLPIMDDQIKSQLAQVYLERGIQYYQKEKEYKKAFAEIENVVYFMPNDTTQLMNAGVYFGPAAEEDQKSLEYIDRYFKAGGKGIDAYIQLVGIYMDRLKDQEKALAAIKKARAAFPKNGDFPRYELGLYLNQKKYDLARKTVKEVIDQNPDDKESYYLLGGLNAELGNVDSAKLAYQKAVDLDPTYFEAQLDLAKLYYQDAKKIKSERDKLGISQADIAKRKTLFDQLQKQYSVALPYWEKAQKIRGDDETVLYTLYEIYGALVMDDRAEVVRKKMKALGYID